MKKITLTTLLLLNLSIYAQPVLNASDIRSTNYGYKFMQGVSTVSNIKQVELSGANVKWDFSTVKIDVEREGGPFFIKPVATAPFSSKYPKANFFFKDSNADNTDNQYKYYNLTNDKLENMGDSDDKEFNVYSNPKTEFVFPFLFNNVLTDTYNEGSGKIDLSIKYDAYGTIITKYGTYKDVLRFKEILIEEDNFRTIIYRWIKLNPYQEIMAASVNDEELDFPFFTIYEPLSTLTIKQNLNPTQFSTSPNPASQNFVIKNQDFATREMFVSVYDILGNQIIKSNRIDSNSKNINISNFSNGLYFIKITDDKNAILYSDKIIKN
jgi:hypothetical protein